MAQPQFPPIFCGGGPARHADEPKKQNIGGFKLVIFNVEKSSYVSNPHQVKKGEPT